MDREAIYQAAFEIASTAPGVVTKSRRLKHFADVKNHQRPALFQTQKRETAIVTTGQPTKWLMEIELYIYVSTAGGLSPGTVLNPIIDALATAFSNPFPGVSQTLGGLVHYARIEGTIETSEGTLGDDEIAIVPIKILAI